MQRLSHFPAALILIICAFACKPETDPQEPPVDEDSIILVKDGISQYSIVYSSAKPNASGLGDFIAHSTGVSLPLVLDKAGTSEFEILVGDCSRSECAEVLGDLSGTFGYSARVVGNKLVVVGSDVTWTAFGLRALVKKLTAECLDGQNLTVPRDLEVKQLDNNPQMIARLIRQNYEFSISPVHVLTQAPVGDIYVAQGAAADGKYFYLVMRNSGDGKAVVFKYDIKSKSLVGQSEEFDGGHCNDMTYDDFRNQVIVAHGQSQGKILTPLDAETLAVQPNITIPVGSGAITFNASRSSYAISQGASTFYVTDRDFKVQLSGKRSDSTGYTAQGMGSDDSYVYFPMSGSKDNILVVYDWEGHFISTITVPLAIESESMFYTAGRYYVAFYEGSKTGGSIYEIKPVHYYTYSR